MALLADVSEAAAVGGEAISALVDDVGYLGAIFVTLILAFAIWGLVMAFIGKGAGGSFDGPAGRGGRG